MLEKLQAEAMRRGDRLGMVPVTQLYEVKDYFDRIGVDTAPYYHFDAPKIRENDSDNGLDFDACTVLVIASPSPISEVVFDVEGTERRFVIPPSYTDYENSYHTVQQYLTEMLQTEDYSLAPARSLPGKALAVYGGIGTYGRNNLLYVEGMGSFLNIFRFYTNYPSELHTSASKPVLRWADTCDHCGLCADHCPTGAIMQGKDVVDGDRCLTAVNEGESDFPAWVESSWHHALIGCMRCQQACPMNQPYLDNVQTVASYDREETSLFLRGELPEDKLAPLGASYFSHHIPRNLRMLLIPRS